MNQSLDKFHSNSFRPPSSCVWLTGNTCARKYGFWCSDVVVISEQLSFHLTTGIFPACDPVECVYCTLAREGFGTVGGGFSTVRVISVVRLS